MGQGFFTSPELQGEADVAGPRGPLGSGWGLGRIEQYNSSGIAQWEDPLKVLGTSAWEVTSHTRPFDYSDLGGLGGTQTPVFPKSFMEGFRDVAQLGSRSDAFSSPTTVWITA